LALHRAGRLNEARAVYKRVLLRDPKHFNALHLLGAVCVQSGEAELAIALLKRAIAVAPTSAASHDLLAQALNVLHRDQEALASFDRSIALQPGNPMAHYNRGTLLHRLTRNEEALASYDRAISLHNNFMQAHYNRGNLLREQRRFEEALTSYDRAIALNPAAPEPQENRGLTLLRLGRPDEAAASYRRAIALRPELAEPHFKLGIALLHLRRIDEALASYDAAIAREPGHVEASLNRGVALLLSGRLSAGWREYEWRKKIWTPDAHIFDQGRQWSGELCSDEESLFLYHEQGLGDTIHFLRYAMVVLGYARRVIVSVQDALLDICQASMPDIEFIGENQRPSRIGHYCSLMSLPLVFSTNIDSMPARSPYLFSDAGRRARFEAMLGPKTKRRVGIVWSGNPDHNNDGNRSIAFARLASLLEADVDWISLHKEMREEDRAAFESSGRVVFCGDELRDFSDTAALADLMDLVITVDTSVAHLAAAMGKPTWILLPFSPDWRWLLDRDDSPWYPSARLFRQPTIGDWESVMDLVKAALDQHSTTFTARPPNDVSL
jgi:tetratricopeptide (TPR) repeat protein